MAKARIMRIAREGWPFIIVLAFVWWQVHMHVGLLYGLPIALGVVYLAAFFYEPDRDVPAEPLAVVAPTDGKISLRRESYDPFLNREAIKISIEVERVGAYMLRAPVEGGVLEIEPNDAKTRTAQASWIRTDEGDDVVFAVSAGSLFGARPCRVRYGERVGQGRRCGLRRLARQVDVYLPLHSRIDIAMGQKVKAGESVLATLVHKLQKEDSDEQAGT